MEMNVKRLSVVCALAGFLIGTPAFAALITVSTPGQLGSNDSTNWSQLGSDGTLIIGQFSATSVLGIGVTGNFTSSDNQGLVATVCPASPQCSWVTSGTGMNGGDTNVWAFDNGAGAGTGPIVLNFTTGILGAGAWVQADAVGTFTAKIEAFDNNGTSLGWFTTTSDPGGDPVFMGVLESPATPQITSVKFSLTACAAGCTLGDFAMNTLEMTDAVTSSAPEPASMLLMGAAFLGIGWKRFRMRSSQRSPRA
jgi:hypothetical protein